MVIDLVKDSIEIEAFALVSATTRGNLVWDNISGTGTGGRSTSNMAFVSIFKLF